MNKNLLEIFFSEHTVDTGRPTAAAIIHFLITLNNYPNAYKEIEEIIMEEAFKLKNESKERMLALKSKIEAATSAKEIIQIMRTHLDPVNQRFIMGKAMWFEDEIIPEIIKLLKTSLNDSFIEMSVQVLVKSEKADPEKLIKAYDEIRNPYAKSLILVAIGFKADETHIPWFMEKYNELKTSYPNEKFCDGAYYALYEMAHRFYPILQITKDKKRKTE